MRFAHVTGILHPDENGYRFEVALDTRTSVRIVRNEHIAELMVRAGEPDPLWTVDQLTQETIGTTLAEQGWEAISMTETEPDPVLGLAVVTYLVRG